MNENPTLYRMNQLMQYTEIEAFPAQKNAGSRVKYFALLDEFIESVPVFTQELIAVEAIGDPDLFQRKIFRIQNILLSIGATSLLLEAEKSVELARKNEWGKCTERTAILASKIERLREKLEAARTSCHARSTDADASSDTVIIAMTQGAGDPNRIKIPFEPQYYEKLRLLIDNFESDQALILLRELMTCSYGNNVDSLLAELYSSLVGFDQDGAERHLQRLAKHHMAGKKHPENERKKILAIDDMPDILNSVKSILMGDYVVYGVTSHKSALKFLTINTPDLILLDIEMPDMDGFTLLGIIRQIKAYEFTPVLFLTSNVTVENILKARRAGGNDFLKKPIDAQVLLSKIKKNLDWQ